MENLHVKFESANRSNEFVLRQGTALPPVAPETIQIEGDINSITAFLSKRENGYSSQSVDQSKVIVIVDKKSMTIKLLLDPEHKYGASILGKLEKSDELMPFYINHNKTFTKEELVKLIKFNRLWFDDSLKHADMVLAFQKTSSTVNISANDSSDTRGNKERDFVKLVTSNAPTEFILNIPVFKGFQPQRFRVEVCLDVTEGSARFWFESVELHEIMQTQLDVIFYEQLKSCQDFVIINK